MNSVTTADLIPEKCFHCGEEIPAGLDLEINIDNEPRRMCCRGCLAVAESIISGGLGNFYQFRTSNPQTPDELEDKSIESLKTYDHPDLQREYIHRIDDSENEARLILEGVVCHACTWLIEKHVSMLKGVNSININYSSNQATIRWDPDKIAFSDILVAVHRLGYKAYPCNPSSEQMLFANERRKQLQRIGLAGLLGMQVMMISIALYTGQWDTGEEIRRFFYWLCLILTMPVVLYSARPFFVGAIRDLKHAHPGMDVPVSLGIGVAFAGSGWSTITGNGHIYFDSVVMFTFFLLIGRYFEFIARKKNHEYIENISRILPATATKLLLHNDKVEEITVPAVKLVYGDRILVRPGETIPVDGCVLKGKSTVNESMITGESLPLFKETGSSVTGGSINIESPLQIQVDKTGENTRLSRIIRLVETAQQDKPRFNELAHRIASWFVLMVLVIAGITAWYWWETEPDKWLPVTIAVLVVTCPCALALATPAALTVAMTKLLQSGLAVTRQDAIEKLARASHYIFDKTGTLTHGNLRLESIHCLSTINKDMCLDIARTLEQHSEHPVAKALLDYSEHPVPNVTEDISSAPGRGLEGRINGEQYYIGTFEFITGETGQVIPEDILIDEGLSEGPAILLANRNSLLCLFIFSDTIRTEARPLIEHIKASGKKVILLSGDKTASVRKVANTLDIDTYYSNLKPEDKLFHLKQLKNRDSIIAMTGDGINDAPVLASADISIAMGSGADLARINADIILLNNQLESLKQGILTAGRTFRIIRQNISWAILYNLMVLPAAVSGLIAPWMAALGMSFSSLVVVGNAYRIRTRQVF